MVYLFHTTYISIDLAHHDIFRAKAGKVIYVKVIPWVVRLYVERFREL